MNQNDDNQKGVFIGEKFLQHWSYTKRKPFSHSMAIVDLAFLILREKRKKLHRATIKECAEGQVFMAIQNIAIRWGWSRCKTKKFLELLEDEGIIEIDASGEGAIISWLESEEIGISIKFEGGGA